MEWNHQTHIYLTVSFRRTLSPDYETRYVAESELSKASDSPNYCLVVLRLIFEPDVEDAIRQAAAVNFNNNLKSRWVATGSSNSINDAEKEEIKSIIVAVMSSSTNQKVLSQLSEAILVIGKHDFPRRWQGLLPDLRSSLEDASNRSDYVCVNVVLATVNSLFKKFRYEFKTNDLLVDFNYCVDNFAEPLWKIFESTAGIINTVVASGEQQPATLKLLIKCQRLCCRIFYSLNFLDLPEFFKDTMDKWMLEFQNYLTVKFPTLEDEKDDGIRRYYRGMWTNFLEVRYNTLEDGSVEETYLHPGLEDEHAVGVELVNGLRAAVCENINHYMEKEEELFQKHVTGFVGALWNQLVFASASSSPTSRDRLTVTAIKFLIMVSKSVHHSLFAADYVLHQICLSIVIPNVMLTDEDEVLFQMNYTEFIRRDIEGSGLDTRRRIACELLKGLAYHYKEKVSQIISDKLQNCLASFAQNPDTNWKCKDCAIFLVVSLATENAGRNSVSTDFVDVENFFKSAIVPELRSRNINGFPMLKAGALKFFTMLWNQISKPTAMTLFPDVVRFLNSDSLVVQSYAASCVDKLLLVKGDGASYTSADVDAYFLELMRDLFHACLLELVHNLLDALERHHVMENQYVSRCMVRVFCVTDISVEDASAWIKKLTLLLKRVCENPKNPICNQYLFEAVAVLVRRACEKNSSLVSSFEASLFPSLKMILAKDVAVLVPCAFHLLSLLVELNNPPLSPHYMQIFEILLLPDSWKIPGNVPALVRFFRSFLQKSPYELNRKGRLNQVLDIFNKLVKSPEWVEQGVYVLNTIIENLNNLGYDVIAPYMSRIWICLFSSYQNNRTPKFEKSFVIFMSLFLVNFGPQNLVTSVEAVEPGIFVMIIEQIWIKSLKLITGPTEIKLTSVASTRLLCESPVFLDPSAGSLWGKMLDSIVTLLSRPEQDRIEEEPDVPDFGETVDYNATFVHLYNAGKKRDDPLKDIKDPKQYMVAVLANLSARSPGIYPLLISENVEQVNQAALLQFCNSYNSPIV